MKPGDGFGVLVESAGFVFVPDWTNGHTVVMDVAAGGVALEPGQKEGASLLGQATPPTDG